MADSPDPSPKGGAKSDKTPIMALVASLVLAPALTFAVAQFVLLPRLKAELAGGAEPTEAEADAEHPVAPPTGKDGSPVGDTRSYPFENMVVNLSGTMGTRYLKCSFVVTGRDPGLYAAFEARRVQLIDVTLSVLSSLSLVELEEAGAKNLLRERLVNAYNQSLGKPLAEQVYFADFVIQ